MPLTLHQYTRLSPEVILRRLANRHQVGQPHNGGSGGGDRDGGGDDGGPSYTRTRTLYLHS